VTKGDNSPQEYDNGRQCHATRIHEEMKEHDVHNHKAKKYKRQWHVTVHQQQDATGELKRRYKEVVM